MSRKRLVINLSETLNNELDKILKKNNKKKSEFIREAVILIEETKKLDFQEQMKNGYEEMAELNLQYCELGFESYNEELNKYETGLLESDFPDDNDSETRRYLLC